MSSDAASVKGGPMSLARARDLSGRRTVFSSGSKAIDEILGGGFRTGEMIEVFGASNTGKTQLGMQATLAPIAAGHAAAYVDTEGTFRPERLSRMAELRGMNPEVVLSKVFVVRAENTAMQLQALKTGRRLEGCRLVVVDTVSKNFSLEYGGALHAARRQIELGAYLNRLNRDAFFHDRAILITNRVASLSAPGTGQPSREVDIGGETMRHAVQRVMRLARRGGEVSATLLTPQPRETLVHITERGLE